MNQHVPAPNHSIAIEGLSCASCVARVEKALLKVPEVRSASVNLATERARVEGGAESDLLAAIQKAGYGATLVPETQVGHAHHHHDEDAAILKRDMIIAAVPTIPLFVLEMLSHFSMPFHMWLAEAVPTRALYLAYFLVTSFVLFVPGRRFFTTGIPALLRGAPEMNSLVALGAGAAYLYSSAVTFMPQALPDTAQFVYYEAAAVIVTLILVGRWLEALAKGRTGRAIEALVARQAKSARVLRGGTETEVPLEQVRVGHVVVVRPGEKIAVDGQVLEGESYVDESMISGEPVPVLRAPGAIVTGGTINGSGSLQIRATRVGGETTLAQIIRMVEEAQGGKLPVQALVDKITGWFVPVVIVLALATFAAWMFWGGEQGPAMGVVNAVAVLIIACPCAMGLATPTSIMVGTGRAAELGVLFRHSEALQILRDVDLVAFDKTGTLTEGKPVLTDFILDDDFEHDEVLALAAAIESRSEHPIARAIVAAAAHRSLPLGQVTEFKSITGQGVQARVNGRLVAVGSRRFFAGMDFSDFEEAIDRFAHEGKTPVFATIDDRLAAAIVVADPVKASSRAVIDRLHAMGVRTAMISGDDQRTAAAIARQLDIDEVRAEVLPAGKVEALQSLRQQGRTAFVGDGINDAPALAAADIGLAVGSGTDVAIESADVVILGSDLKGVLNALQVSRLTMTNIWQNLFWAFGYNVLLIPLAAGALYPAFGLLLSPMIGAGAMALSSVLVVGNAQRLRTISGVSAPVSA